MKRGKNGFVLWPTEAFLARRKLTETVAARIRRLNPDGIEEGGRPRGWHPKFNQTFWYNAISIRDFCARFGGGALRALPKSAFISLGGKRRAVSERGYDEFIANG